MAASYFISLKKLALAFAISNPPRHLCGYVGKEARDLVRPLHQASSREKSSGTVTAKRLVGICTHANPFKAMERPQEKGGRAVL
jgi:hypothetical protein